MPQASAVAPEAPTDTPPPGALVAVEQQPLIALGSLQASNSRELVAAATEMATTLAEVISKQKLAERIQGKEYVKVEGWTTLATMLAVLPHEVSVTFEESTGRYEAVVELRRMGDGATLCRASAECGGPDDWVDKYKTKTWSDRPRYARRSMAITRAVSKSCRISFSWVMALAGYMPTPLEEVPEGGFPDDDRGPPPRQPRQRQPAAVAQLSSQETITLWEGRLQGCQSINALAKTWGQAQAAAKALGDKSVQRDLADVKDRRKVQLSQPLEGEVVEREPGADDEPPADDDIPY